MTTVCTPSLPLSVLDAGSPWAAVFDQAGLAIAVLSPEFDFIRVNEAYARADGKTPDWFLGRNHFEVYPQPGMRAIFTAVLAENRPFAHTARAFAAVSNPRRGINHCDWTLTPGADAGGNVTCLVLTIHDVTARVRSEERARIGERDLRTLLHHMPGMVYRAHPDWSAELILNAEALTGHTPEQINALPRKWLDVVHPDDRAIVLAGAAELHDGPRQIVQTYRIVRRDGDLRWVEDRKSSMFADDGSFVGVEGVVFDISGRHLAETSPAESEARFRHLFAAMAAGVALVEIIRDADGQPSDYRCLDVNPAFAAIAGRAAGEIVGRPLQAVLPAAEAWLQHFRRVATSGETVRFESGRHLRLTVCRPQAGQLAIICDDIGATRQHDEQLHLAAAAFAHTRDGIMITDLESRIVAVNRAFTEITGYREDEMLGRNPRILQSGRHGPEFFRALWREMAAKGFWQGEIWNRRKNGEIFPEWLTLTAAHDADGRLTRYIGVFTDISRIKDAEARLEFAMHHDALTGLPNRALLSVRHQHALERSRRHGRGTALLLLDLDHFKNVNDTLGHVVGDRLLIAVAGRLLARLRDEDTLTRLGGDEFAVLMDEITSPNDAAVLAADLLAALDAPFDLGDVPEIHITASIGISVSPDDGSEPMLLMRNADAAVYQAKNHGRHGIHFYTAALTTAARQRMTTELRLRKAIEQGHLVLHFQPLIAAGNGGIIGAEALVRWQDPDEGLIPPLHFIPVAEDSGLIAPLGAWVLHAACRQMKAWHDAGRALQTIAVNLSPRQFALQDVPELVRQALAESGLEARFLELEITESTLMGEREGTLAMLGRLRDLGVRLSIDDFGTGYSSLGYLKRFPIDKLKIDQSFVRDISSDPNDAEIAATIIAMARSLKLSVVAEGVETIAQRAFLDQQGCDYYQGYLFSRPVAAADFPEHLG